MTKRQNILVCGVNWIGDAIMSMPALQVFKREHPEARITLLVKPSMKALWSMHDVPDETMLLSSGGTGTWRTARAVAERRFDLAYVLPHSFRSAFIPFLARVPTRVGLPGHARDWMLTEVVQLPPSIAGEHQSAEYAALLLNGANSPQDELPVLTISDEAREAAKRGCGDVDRPCVGLIPGAARGSSKRWPLEHFNTLGKELVAERSCGILIFGTAGERALCDELAAGIGDGARSLAGRTSFETWAASLALCDVVVANDSGGMHVAAAVGTPVVALYGMTDPQRTGPLGERCTVLQKSRERSRDVPRVSAEAERWLAAITPDEAFRAVDDIVRNVQPA